MATHHWLQTPVMMRVRMRMSSIRPFLGRHWVNRQLWEKVPLPELLWAPPSKVTTEEQDAFETSLDPYRRDGACGEAKELTWRFLHGAKCFVAPSLSRTGPRTFPFSKGKSPVNLRECVTWEAEKTGRGGGDLPSGPCSCRGSLSAPVSNLHAVLLVAFLLPHPSSQASGPADLPPGLASPCGQGKAGTLGSPSWPHSWTWASLEMSVSGRFFVYRKKFL